MTAYMRSSFVGKRRKTVPWPTPASRAISSMLASGPDAAKTCCRRVEHPLEIAPRVGAKLGHQAAEHRLPVSASASIRATSRLRRSATKAMRLSPTKTAAPANA